MCSIFYVDILIPYQDHEVHVIESVIWIHIF